LLSSVPGVVCDADREASSELDIRVVS
jgi:hypothetical protein